MLLGLYQGINVVSCAKSARTSSTRSVILSQIDNKKKQRTYSLSQLAGCLPGSPRTLLCKTNITFQPIRISRFVNTMKGLLPEKRPCLIIPY